MFRIFGKRQSEKGSSFQSCYNKGGQLSRQLLQNKRVVVTASPSPQSIAKPHRHLRTPKEKPENSITEPERTCHTVYLKPITHSVGTSNFSNVKTARAKLPSHNGLLISNCPRGYMQA
ncbi:hypothetical protein CEXT_274031 [Caerostris extrusa]|uniref:Uncharacterized protein n=1 Tax=Caerostris extrusa TaxID=172846 RepID=A0AAV4T2Z3_CAEEX|nr:hypothetical protein CEXT_274031 [Caerostris extrusa]